MVESIGNSANINTFAANKSINDQHSINRPLLNFDKEDEAIISAQAKILNELDKYNTGKSNELDLVLTTVMAEHQVNAAAYVIDKKIDMADTILKLGSE